MSATGLPRRPILPLFNAVDVAPEGAKRRAARSLKGAPSTALVHPRYTLRSPSRIIGAPLPSQASVSRTPHQAWRAGAIGYHAPSVRQDDHPTIATPPSAVAPPRFSRAHWTGLALLLAASLAVLLCADRLRSWRWRARLESALSDEERTTCVAHLSRLERSALPAVRTLLEHAESRVRLDAVRVLEQISDSRAVGLLQDAMHDPTEEVRIEAVAALGRRGGAEVVTALAPVLHSSDERLAMHAVVALAEIGSPQTWDILDEAVSAAEKPGVRVQIIEEISACRRRESLPALRRCLDDAAVFEGWTVGQRRAAGQFAILQPRIETALNETQGWTLDLPRRHVVNEEAAAAISLLAPASFAEPGVLPHGPPEADR